MKKILFVFLLFVIITSTSYVMLSMCDCNCQVCFYLDKKSCPISDEILNASNLGVSIWQWVQDQYGSYAVPIADLNEPLSAETEKKVSGYEINWGFFSKDSYREYTWEEMFEWKYKRKPTQSELDNLTAEQVMEWFIERHTVHRSILPDDPPRDVRTFEKTKYHLCTNLFTNCDYEYGGKIYFPDGTSCDLEHSTLNLGSGDCPVYILMKVKKGCSKCGL